MKAIFIITILVWTSGGITIVNFEKDSDMENWFIVNDGVMGGLSEGKAQISDDGYAIFEGTVSLENNGGFTSLRHSFKTTDIKGKTKVKIRVKGDGKKYQFRVKNNSSDWYSYINYFETSGEWETIEMELSEFYPSFRGMELDMPNFSAEQLSDITFLISNKVAESFKLEIDSIILE